mmetsp:Transcript_36808/g.97284  ORF Transcript_36808/g.97284 Transcript_36808/m.97284 type:complete len:217 (+) Transcript_36808:322-972(+)
MRATRLLSHSHNDQRTHCRSARTPGYNLVSSLVLLYGHAASGLCLRGPPLALGALRTVRQHLTEQPFCQCPSATPTFLGYLHNPCCDTSALFWISLRVCDSLGDTQLLRSLPPCHSMRESMVHCLTAMHATISMDGAVKLSSCEETASALCVHATPIAAFHMRRTSFPHFRVHPPRSPLPLPLCSAPALHRRRTSCPLSSCSCTQQRFPDKARLSF